MQLKSVALQKYVSADNGGGMNVTVDRDAPSSWETFRVRSKVAMVFYFNFLSSIICCNDLIFSD